MSGEDWPELAGRAEDVAPRLLGAVLRSDLGGEATAGRIVEVEAYLGPHDPASHAAERFGRTARNRTMFGPAGRAYVYRSYGIHWCFNVVTGSSGDPAAVLVRALEPLEGVDVMARRRGRPRDLCSGPGRLCQALGIDGALDGHDLRDAPVRLLDLPASPPPDVRVSPRIGITRARDWPQRYFVASSPHVSRSRRGDPLTPPTRPS